MVSIKVFALFLAAASAQTVLPLVNKVDVLYVRVADCEGCGMTDGQVSVKVCGKEGVGCCETGILVIGEDQVFVRGQVATFKGSDLGQCEGFDMGKFEWVRVMADAGRYQCKFHESLDGSNSEEG